eukprot:SAG22_NODE_809_length_7067_cov_5.261768_1_plen_385_part_10
MIRCKFFRCSTPPPAGPEAAAAAAAATAPLSGPAFDPSLGGSAAQRSIWESLLAWHRGQGGGGPLPPPPPPPGDALPTVAAVRDSRSDSERLGACYAMARHVAAAASPAAAGPALLQLEELLLCERRPVVQRAAMYGLAAAGPAAAPVLLRLLRSHAVASAEADTIDDPMASARLNTALRALFALGEAAAPTAELVELLGELLADWLAKLRAECALVAAGGDSGGTTGRLAGWHRATAIAVQALSLLAERVLVPVVPPGPCHQEAAAVAADSDPLALQLRIGELLLPLTVELDPIGDTVPSAQTYTGSGNAAFWISEAAAIGLLRLVSSGGRGQQEAVAAVAGGIVTPLSPASQTDQRYVQALCLLALERCRATNGGGGGGGGGG